MIDLDSHLMEPADYLVAFAPRRLHSELVMAGAPTAAQVAAGDAGQWSIDGAFDRGARRRLLDERGISRQVVLPGLSHVAHLGTSLALPAARAQRRAVLAWADDDARFVPVAVVPIDEPEHAVALIGEAVEAGIATVQLTTARRLPPPPIERDQQRIWDAIADAGAVAVLHFGTTGTVLPDAWRSRRRATDPAGSVGDTIDEPIDEPRAEHADPIDVVIAHHAAEAVVARLALSGMLGDRGGRPPLRLLIAEHGAGWLPPLLVSLDACQRAFRRLDADIPQDEPLSAQVVRALTVVPFVFEPIGPIIDRIGPEVLGFATDHPHPEGGRDPSGSFRVSLGDRDGAAFFEGNARRLLDGPS